MKSVDTNVLLRAMLGDDPVQSSLAVAQFAAPTLITVSVVLETVWFFWRRLGAPIEAIAAAFDALRSLGPLTIAEADAVVWAFGNARTARDFADLLHVALSAGADAFVTFDERLARVATAGPVAVELLVPSAS